MLSAYRYVLPGMLFAAGCGFAQTAAAATVAAGQPAPAKVEMPSDPAALLALAAKKNGLQNAGPEPWHLKATYEVLDDKGGVRETGTFEEWWISEKQYKLSYTSPSFNQTDFSTDAGVFRVGNPEWPDESAAMVQRSLFPSFPSGELLTKRKFKAKDQKSGNFVLKCVTGENSAPVALPSDSLHCFNPDAPILRIDLLGGLYEVVYNGISLFGGAYIAHSMQVTRLSKPFLHVQIDALDRNVPAAESLLVPPSTAIGVGRRAVVDFGVSGNILRKAPPQYSVEAKAARVQGIVYLSVTIGKDGKVTDVRPIVGPPMLIDSSIRAVRQWEYKPYLLGGEAVECQIVVRMEYSLAP